MTRAAVYGSPAWRRWKHDHHWATTPPAGDPFGAGNTALITSLGGNSAVLGFYDTRKNVTATTTVSEWDDVRGSSGFGPSLIGTSGHQPTWDSANQVITTDGSTVWLASSPVALFANSGVGLTLVYVGTVPSASGTLAYATTVFDSASINAGVGVATSTTNVICARFRAGTANSTVASGATRRLVFAAKESGTAGEVEVPTNAQVRVFGSAATSANCQVTVGGIFPSGTTVSGGLAISVRAILVLAGLYTTAQRDALKTWVTTYHNVTLL